MIQYYTVHTTHMLIPNFSAIKDKILFKFPITESSMLVANWSKHNFVNIYRSGLSYIYHCFSEKHWTANGFYIFAILRQRATTFPYAIKGPNFYCGTIPFIPFLISHVHQRQCSSPLNFVCVLFSVRKSKKFQLSKNNPIICCTLWQHAFSRYEYIACKSNGFYRGRRGREMLTHVYQYDSLSPF